MIFPVMNNLQATVLKQKNAVKKISDCYIGPQKIPKNCFIGFPVEFFEMALGCHHHKIKTPIPQRWLKSKNSCYLHFNLQ